MIYLTNFIFPSDVSEEMFLHEYYGQDALASSYHTNMYPFRTLSDVGLFRMDFEPITLLCGGKSTALNVISQKLHVARRSIYNSGELMEKYVEMCSFETDMRWVGEEFDMTGSRSPRYDIGDMASMITSDDIFKALLQHRADRDQRLMKSRMLTEAAVAMKNSRRADLKFMRHIDFETG